MNKYFPAMMWVWIPGDHYQFWLKEAIRDHYTRRYDWMMTRTRDQKLQNYQPHETLHFVNSSHQTVLLDGLNALREQAKLFDITLIVEGQVFRAHKVVLSACSDYFRAMFTDNMLEARQTEIRLNGITRTGFRELLDYAYTSKLGLNMGNVQDVLEAASHVQFHDVICMCSNFLQAVIDVENCVDVTTIAETYSLDRLTLHAYKYMSGHLLEFSRTEEFYRLTPKQLQNILAYDFPVDCSEADVLRIVLTWFFHVDNTEMDMRKFSYASNIVSSIHFDEISRRKLESIMEKMFSDRMNERNLYKIVMAEINLQTSVSARQVSKYLINSRGMELAILKVGGFGVGGITNEITYRFATGKTWKHLTSIPHVEQCNFGTAVFNNELFIIGGCFNQSLQENVHPFGFKFSPRYNKWSTIAPMKVERCRFTLNAIGSLLYAVGGDTEGELDSKVCECYNTANDTWSLIQPLPVRLIQHAGATFDDGYTRKLFISGGMDRFTLQSNLYCYDVATDKWRMCAAMQSPRADHAMLAIGRNLYVCGGWTEDGEHRMRHLVETIDVYNIDTNTWTILTRVPTPRYHAGIVGVDNKIYIIGGFQSDAMFDKGTAAIECYNIDEDSWMSEEKYPQDIWEHTCATLYIPRCRDDMVIIPNPLPSS